MIFWSVVLGVVAIVLVIAWRKDRNHKVTIDRRNGAVETDIGGGAMYGGGGPNAPDGGGGGL